MSKAIKDIQQNLVFAALNLKEFIPPKDKNIEKAGKKLHKQIYPKFKTKKIGYFCDGQALTSKEMKF